MTCDRGLIASVVETVVFGYYRMDKRNRIIDSHDIYMDPIIRQSMGIWLDVPSVALKKIDELEIDRMASIHGAGIVKEHHVVNWS